MSTNAVPASGLITDEDMSEPQVLRLAGGEAVVYSRRCPGQAANEDCAACFVLQDGGILAVADGMGGTTGSEVRWSRNPGRIRRS